MLNRPPSHDVLLITFDSLRLDVAVAAWEVGSTPFLRSCLPQGWEPRHSPGNFTYAAHAAIFAGFWPTPCTGGINERPFALHFPDSSSVGQQTVPLGGDNIVSGLAARGYRTVCIGGVGFFNPATPLGAVFPRLFSESHWRPEFGVTSVHSPRAQIQQACRCVADCPPEQPLFLFMNIAATHPPTHPYIPGSGKDSVATQQAALAYVDRLLPGLFDQFKARTRGGVAYLMSDHGTLFGEEGKTGHRTGHPIVWTVPYAEYVWESQP